MTEKIEYTIQRNQIWKSQREPKKILLAIISLFGICAIYYFRKTGSSTVVSIQNIAFIISILASNGIFYLILYLKTPKQTTILLDFDKISLNDKSIYFNEATQFGIAKNQQYFILKDKNNRLALDSRYWKFEEILDKLKMKINTNIVKANAIDKNMYIYICLIITLIAILTGQQILDRLIISVGINSVVYIAFRIQKINIM